MGWGKLLKRGIPIDDLGTSEQLGARLQKIQFDNGPRQTPGMPPSHPTLVWFELNSSLLAVRTQIYRKRVESEIVPSSVETMEVAGEAYVLQTEHRVLSTRQLSDEIVIPTVTITTSFFAPTPTSSSYVRTEIDEVETSRVSYGPEAEKYNDFLIDEPDQSILIDDAKMQVTVKDDKTWVPWNSIAYRRMVQDLAASLNQQDPVQVDELSHLHLLSCGPLAVMMASHVFGISSDPRSIADLFKPIQDPASEVSMASLELALRSLGMTAVSVEISLENLRRVNTCIILPVQAELFDEIERKSMKDRPLHFIVAKPAEDNQWILFSPPNKTVKVAQASLLANWHGAALLVDSDDGKVAEILGKTGSYIVPILAWAAILLGCALIVWFVFYRVPNGVRN